MKQLKILLWALVALAISLGFNVAVLLALNSWRPLDAPPAPPSNVSISPVPVVPVGQLPEHDLAVAEGAQ